MIGISYVHVGQEGRFKSQALLDEAGILTAMVYVDLNPIRAGIAKTPEDSEFTSIYQRIRQTMGTRSPKSTDERRVRLRGFADQSHNEKTGIPYTASDYLQLVDWSGRSVRAGKPGRIDADLPPILSRLSIDPEVWQLAMSRKGTILGRAMGRLDVMRLHAATLGQAWVRGMNQSRRMYAH